MSRVRAIHTFSYGTKNGDLFIHGGTTYDAEDRVVKSFPQFFEAIPDYGPPAKRTIVRRRPTNG